MSTCTYPKPSATLLASGNKSGITYGTSYLFESPVTRELAVGESFVLEQIALRSISFVLNHHMLGDTGVDIIVDPPVAEDTVLLTFFIS
jgi:hypothetical protein